MSEPFLGEIRMFGGNFAPKSWALCNGQLLSIQQNSALFSLMGTTYGGNGIQNFQLPNLQSRLPIGQGNGPGLTPRVIGELGGEESVTITTATMPQHNHIFMGSTAASTATQIGASVLPAKSPSNGGFYALNTGSPAPTIGVLNAASVGNSGGSQGHSNIMPYMCITFIIALAGVFPSRN